VFSTFSLCPQYDPSTSMAFPLRLYCVPKATPRRSSATQTRLCYVLCVLTATLRRLLRLSGDFPATVRMYYVFCVLTASLLRCCCDYGDSTAIPRRPNQDSAQSQSSATVLCMFKIVADGLRPCASLGSSLRLRCVPAASMATVLRPGS